jgi:hypothetical protein
MLYVGIAYIVLTVLIRKSRSTLVRSLCGGLWCGKYAEVHQ